ncbi:radical SAM protein [Pelomyxa schiedti]|nr:radical SAM protein [Pelomyxa schiedti]
MKIYDGYWNLLNKQRISYKVIAEGRILQFYHPEMKERLPFVTHTLREHSLSCIDDATAKVLQYSDMYCDKGQHFQVSYSTKSYVIGIWVNFAKNYSTVGTLGEIEFSNVHTCAKVPESLALTSTVIRLLHTSFDVITPPTSEFITIGGVLYYEILGFPPRAKKLNNWTLRPVTPQSLSISRHTYIPLIAEKGDNLTDSATLKVSYLLPPHVLVRDFHVGWWDKEKSKWQTDGISEIAFNKATRIISFHTLHATPHALIQPRFTELPFKWWCIYPSGPSKAWLILITKTLEITIEVSEQGCKLVFPLIYEPGNQPKPPPLFLEDLARYGIFLPWCVPASVLPWKKKDVLMEKRIYSQMSKMLPGFAFSCSKWNCEAGPKKAIILARIANSLSQEPPPFVNKDLVLTSALRSFESRTSNTTTTSTSSSHNHSGVTQRSHPTSRGSAATGGLEINSNNACKGWKSILISEIGNVVVVNSELQSKFSSSPLSGAKVHGHLFHNLKELTPETHTTESKAQAKLMFQRIQALHCYSVHIGGGEPMLNIEGLCGVLEAANEEGMSIDYVETNSSWFRDGHSAVETLRKLYDRGLRTLLVSISPFHNEAIPFSKVQGVLTACDDVGMDVMPWVQDFRADLASRDVNRLYPLEDWQQLHSNYLSDISEKYWLHPGGRAIETLRPLSKQKTLERIFEDNPGSCARNLSNVTHFHVDLYGKYIPGLCSGFGIDVEDMGKPLSPLKYPVINALYTGGVRSLFSYIQEFHPEVTRPQQNTTTTSTPTAAATTTTTTTATTTQTNSTAPPAQTFSGKCDLCTQLRRSIVTHSHPTHDLHPLEFYSHF